MEKTLERQFLDKLKLKIDQSFNIAEAVLLCIKKYGLAISKKDDIFVVHLMKNKHMVITAEDLQLEVAVMKAVVQID